MPKRDEEQIALRALKAKEVDLQLDLNRIQKLISAMERGNQDRLPDRLKAKSDLLLQWFRSNPEAAVAGTPIKDVPRILEAMGHVSRAVSETTNWLCPSQLPPEKRYFIRKRGIIKPRPDVLLTILNVPGDKAEDSREAAQNHNPSQQPNHAN